MDITHLEGKLTIKICAKAIILEVFHLDTYFVHEIHKSRDILK
jgi:hypothetical protein